MFCVNCFWRSLATGGAEGARIQFYMTSTTPQVPHLTIVAIAKTKAALTPIEPAFVSALPHAFARLPPSGGADDVSLQTH